MHLWRPLIGMRLRRECKNMKRITFALLILIAFCAGILFSWFFPHLNLVSHFSQGNAKIDTSSGTKIIQDYMTRTLAWDGPHPIEGVTPIHILGRGVVQSSSDLHSTFTEQKEISGTAVHFVIFKLTELDADFLKNQREVSKLQGGETLYLGCYLSLSEPEKLTGQEVDIPSSSCSSGYDLKMKNKNGEFEQVGSFFH
jgi:hypothetical protein